MINIAIIGAGGFGREVLDLLEACNAAGQQYNVLGFVVDKQYGIPGTLINDKPILGDFGWLESHVDEVAVVCTVGTPKKRHALVLKAQQVGCHFGVLLHKRSESYI